MSTEVVLGGLFLMYVLGYCVGVKVRAVKAAIDTA
jgi:hypothetical protein